MIKGRYMEIWKRIEGFDTYEVSNLGRVKSIQHLDSMGRLKDGHYLKPALDGKGNYLHVNLYKNGKSHPKNVHRLVANAFISNPNSYREINHKDEDKTNNAASNLEWCTHKYNNNYGSKQCRSRGTNNPMNKITSSIVEYIKKNHKACGGTMRNKDLAEAFNISPTHVCAIAHGRRWGYATADRHS